MPRGPTLQTLSGACNSTIRRFPGADQVAAPVRGIVHFVVAATLPAIVGRDEELAAVTTFLDGEFPAALVLARRLIESKL